MKDKQTNVLYISITGMSESLGKSQVLEYLQDLSIDYGIFLHSFEKDTRITVLQDIQNTMNTFGINWTYQVYSNKYGVLSTFQQITSSFLKLITIVAKQDIKIIHARSLIPVLIALLLKMVFKTKVIFDIRGFQTDEKTEVGRIKYKSVLYFILKFLERFSYQYSDSIVTLTYASKKIIDSMTLPSKVSVIPTCANNRLFKIVSKSEKAFFKKSLGYNGSDKIIIHAGTVSNWYDFDSELLLMQKIMKKDNSIHFLILNKGEHNFILEKIHKYSLDISRIKVIEVSFYDMYKYLNIANASLFIIKPTYSKIASAPTKFAENLACGLFSITNNGIGDMDRFFSEYPSVGYSFNIKELTSSLDCICDTILSKIAFAHENKIEVYMALYNKYLSKEMAIKKYSTLYNSLIFNAKG
ncbi:MAG: hypothetical protein WAX77_09460 [Methylococcaceae bacterium]